MKSLATSLSSTSNLKQTMLGRMGQLEVSVKSLSGKAPDLANWTSTMNELVNQIVNDLVDLDQAS